MNIGENMLSWSYLCRRHYYWARLRGDSVAWGYVSDEPPDDNGDFHCDWKGTCKRKPYREVFTGCLDLMGKPELREYKPLEEVEKEYDNEGS